MNEISQSVGVESEPLVPSSKGTWGTVTIGDRKYPSYVKPDGNPFILVSDNKRPLIITGIETCPSHDSSEEPIQVATIYVDGRSAHILWKNGEPLIGMVDGISYYTLADGSFYPGRVREILRGKEAGVYKQIGRLGLAHDIHSEGGDDYVCIDLSDAQRAVYKPVMLDGERMIIPRQEERKENDTDFSSLSFNGVSLWNGKLIEWDPIAKTFSVFKQNGIVFDKVRKLIATGNSIVYEYTFPTGRLIRVTQDKNNRNDTKLWTLHGFFIVDSLMVPGCVEFLYGDTYVHINPNEKISGDDNSILYAQYDGKTGEHIGWFAFEGEFQEITEEDMKILPDPINKFPNNSFPDQISSYTDNKGVKKFITWCYKSTTKSGLLIFCQYFDAHGSPNVEWNNTSQYRYFQQCADGTLKFVFNDAYHIQFDESSGAITIQSPKRNTRYILSPRGTGVHPFEPIATHNGHDVLQAMRKDNGEDVYIRIARDGFKVEEIHEISSLDEADIDFHGFAMNHHKQIIIEGEQYNLSFPERNSEDGEEAIIRVGNREHIVLKRKGEFFLCSVQDKVLIPLPDSLYLYKEKKA